MQGLIFILLSIFFPTPPFHHARVSSKELGFFNPRSQLNFTSVTYSRYSGFTGHTLRVRVSRKKLMKEGEGLIASQSITHRQSLRNFPQKLFWKKLKPAKYSKHIRIFKPPSHLGCQFVSVVQFGLPHLP